MLTAFPLNENARRLTGLKSGSRVGYKEIEAFLSKEELATVLTKEALWKTVFAMHCFIRLISIQPLNVCFLGGYGCLVIF